MTGNPVQFVMELRGGWDAAMSEMEVGDYFHARPDTVELQVIIARSLWLVE